MVADGRDGPQRRAELSATLGVQIVYTLRVGGGLGCECEKDSHEDPIHARQLVPAGAVYLLLLPKYWVGYHLTVRANTTEAPIHF